MTYAHAFAAGTALRPISGLRNARFRFRSGLYREAGTGGSVPQARVPGCRRLLDGGYNSYARMRMRIRTRTNGRACRDSAVTSTTRGFTCRAAVAAAPG